MAALGIRSNLARHGESYLMPLPATQVNRELMEQYLAEFAALPADKRQMESLVHVEEQGERHLLGEGFTVTVNLVDT